MTYTREQITLALNRACDAVQDMAWTGDEEDLTDATNLITNAGLHFLDNPGASLPEAIEDQYGDFGEHLIELVKEAML